MGTLAPPKTKEFSEKSIEKVVYNLVDRFSNHLPISNDRNRFGFSLYKYMTGEGDPPEILVKSLKMKIEGISPGQLAEKIKSELEKVKK
jgi:hypothetical protein